jgi:hypothetical protein
LPPIVTVCRGVCAYQICALIKFQVNNTVFTNYNHNKVHLIFRINHFRVHQCHWRVNLLRSYTSHRNRAGHGPATISLWPSAVHGIFGLHVERDGCQNTALQSWVCQAHLHGWFCTVAFPRRGTKFLLINI